MTEIILKSEINEIKNYDNCDDLKKSYSIEISKDFVEIIYVDHLQVDRTLSIEIASFEEIIEVFRKYQQLKNQL